MAFRKRNTPLSGNLPHRPFGTQNIQSTVAVPEDTETNSTPIPAHGTRPSPLDGRPTTSTGTASLDSLLAGHAGLPLGTSLMIEESGTTDYAGSLLRFYAAEGVVHGQRVFVVGMGEGWGRELPGLVVDSGNVGGKEEGRGGGERMKIAWRYERFGDGGGGPGARGALIDLMDCSNDMLMFVVGPSKSQSDGNAATAPTFCNTFDLTKRLTIPSPKAITYLPIRSSAGINPFDSVIETLSRELSTADKSIHRLVIPTLLSPAIYPDTVYHPTKVLPFLHSLRALLRLHPTRLTAMISLPLTLFPRSTGLTRWIELLSDGVIELVPFPHTVDAGPPLSSPSDSGNTSQEEKPQGLVRIHRLPVFHERGGGGASGSGGVGDDLAFTLSRRRFAIKPFSLPPVEGDQEAQHGEAEGGKVKVDIDF